MRPSRPFFEPNAAPSQSEFETPELDQSLLGSELVFSHTYVALPLLQFWV